MLEDEALRTIDGWEKDKFGDYICEWKRSLGENEVDDPFDAFVLTIQKQGENEYHTDIAVAFTDGRVGDLLSAKYYEESRTVEEAMATGEEFVQEVEDEYGL